VVLFNIHDCWDSLLHMLDDLREQGLLRHNLAGRLVVANSLDEIKHYITHKR
jgi:hypothetical protein